MAKLYFRYGAMGSSKTANALMVAFNYEEKGLKPLVLKPRIDTRDGQNIIKSRIGLERECKFTDEYLKKHSSHFEFENYDVIIIDEVQFCTIDEIKELRKIVTYYNIPAICYGLMTDFLAEPFETSAYLTAIADKVEEIKTVCWCGDGATCNARLDKYGNVIRSGERIVLGGNETYTSLCRKHYDMNDIGTKMRAKFNKN